MTWGERLGKREGDELMVVLVYNQREEKRE